MIRSLYTGLSGIIGSQYGLDVTGNNIAGVNTLSFKYSRPTFRTLFEQNLYSGQPGNRVGLGSMISTVDRVMTMGNIENTDHPTDMAIGGSGFFLVRGIFQRKTLNGETAINQQDFLSRVGNFRIDSDYNFVQGNSGLLAMGILAKVEDGDIVITDDLPSQEEMIQAPDKTEYLRMLQPISFKDLVIMPPKETQAITLGGFLNSEAGLDPVYFTLPAGPEADDGEYIVRIQFSRKLVKEEADDPLIQDMDDLLFQRQKVYQLETDVIRWPKMNDPEEPAPKPVFSGGNGYVVMNPDGTVDRSFFPGLHDDLDITINEEAFPLNLIASIEERPFQMPSASAHVGIFDSLGKEHVLRVRYEKTMSNQWLYRFESPSEDPQQRPSFLIAYQDQEGNTYSTYATEPERRILGGILEFDSSGKIADQKVMMADGTIQDISLERILLFDAEENSFAIETHFTDHEKQLVQTALPYDLYAQQKEGRSTGSLLGLSVHAGGLLYGMYSNSHTVPVARIPIINVRAPENLQDASRFGLSNVFEFQVDPTIPNFIGLFRAGEGGTGGIHGQSIEMSNVDVSREMTNMIKYQRALQLNARSITTADSILEETIRLKR